MHHNHRSLSLNNVTVKERCGLKNRNSLDTFVLMFSDVNCL